jgi:hypothetical protein
MTLNRDAGASKIPKQENVTQKFLAKLFSVMKGK